ncbi:MAG: T9SS type A sorting domain-containing protein, partial [Bacteroidetes bacterium]|nr:T9SS type A sorting domain-containing protein [Bacteroidota bacterium]
GTGVIDSKNLNYGTLNLGTRLTSGASVGDASVHDYVNATKSATLSHASGESLTVTSSSGNPDGILVYRVDEQPNTLSGTVGLGAMNKYFGVFQVGGTSPQYSAVYNYTGNPDVTASNEGSLLLYKRTDNSAAGWMDGSASLDIAANTLSLTGQSTEYILGSAVILPLHLLSFTAYKQEASVLLQWQTTGEVNTSYFELERGNDGQKFEKIGITAAVNSNGTHAYQFTDKTPAKGINYYRLKQVDRDEHYTYSTIAKVVFEGNDQELTVYPNPASNIITISQASSQKTVTLTIFDQQGRKLLVKELTNKNTFQVDISSLTKGVYTIQINDAVKQSSAKLIKL